MWFKRVPRLGSYMAVPLIYQSCLTDEALDQALADWNTSSQQRAELQKEIEVFEEEQNNRREAALSNNEPFEPETREWPEIETPPFVTFD